MDEMLKLALELGSTEAGWLPTGEIRFLQEVRAMCERGHCGYGKNWGCPPGCGPVEDCAKKVLSYEKGLLFTYAARMEDPFDYEAIQDGGKKIRVIGGQLREKLEAMGKTRIWMLLPGPCGVCKKCQYPEPCIHPELAESSPEAQGMWVSEICTQAGMQYNNGKNSVTYVGLAFFA